MSYYKNNNNKTIPNKAKQKKGVAFWVVFVLMIFWTVCSVLSICNFVGNKQETRITASADTAIGANYYSRDYYFPTSRYIRSTAQVEDNNHVGNYLKVRFDWVSLGNNSPTFRLGVRAVATVIPNDPEFSGDGYTSNNSPVLSIYNGLGNNLSPQNTFYPSFEFNPSTDNGREFYLGYTTTSANYNTFSSYLGRFSVYVDPQFNGIPVKIVRSSNYVDRDNGRQCNNTMTYYDINGFKFAITFQKWINNNQYTNFFTLEYAEYFLEDLPSNGDNSPDYLAGLIIGRQEGITQGREEGYQNGYNSGKAAGESIGYNKGVEAANTYSFLGLFSALVDVPVKAITSFFDFTILGFSLRQLISSIFTVCVIVIIIKIILGGVKNG